MSTRADGFNRWCRRERIQLSPAQRKVAKILLDASEVDTDIERFLFARGAGRTFLIRTFEAFFAGVISAEAAVIGIPVARRQRRRRAAVVVKDF